ncbi:MAG TPA: hypothetical protein DDZ22_18305, partial [Massilia sp.]|nr:hypothetical protein [Massilia sp.]
DNTNIAGATPPWAAWVSSVRARAGSAGTPSPFLTFSASCQADLASSRAARGGASAGAVPACAASVQA